MRTNSMAAMIPEQGIGRAQVQGAGGEAETVAVPASALRLFLNLLTEMSQGNAVTLVPAHVECTTQLTGEGEQWGQRTFSADGNRVGRQITSGFTTESPSAMARAQRAWSAQTN